MDKSEPTLVPEWLKSSGSSTGGTIHQSASSTLQSDNRIVSNSARSKPSVKAGDRDIGRSFVPDRTTSSYFRRSSSSNGYAHSRTLGRSNRDRDWEKDTLDFHDKGKSILGDHRHRNLSEPLGNILSSSFEKDVLRRSQSMMIEKRGETWPQKVGGNSISAQKSNHNNSNGLVHRGSAVGSVPKSAFERDFPTLGAEERPKNPDITRASSPGLSPAIQSLSIGISTMIGGDGWTSALAEVPLIVGNNGTGGSIQQTASATTPSGASSTAASLNMAEALAHSPSRAHATTQLSAGTQRLEELAIKQSRQLVPMTPSMPKATVLNPSEKPKPKSGPSPRGAPAKSDVSQTSTVGKLHILKPARERNGVSPTARDPSSPTSKTANISLAVAPSVVGSAPLRSPRSNTPNLVSTERKTRPTTLDKRPVFQSQSRNDFFNLMRKKSMTKASVVLDPCHGVPSSSVSDKSDKTDDGNTVSPRIRDDLSEISVGDCLTEKMDGDASERSQDFLNNEKNHSSLDSIFCSEEEEAAFLRSLGWEENAGEDEGLTEEEISEYYRSRPTLRKPKLLVVESIDSGGSSGFSPSDSKRES